MKVRNAKDQDSNVILFTQGLEKAFQGKQLTDSQRKIFPDAFKIAKPHMDSEFCKVIEDHLTAVLKINPMAHELSPNGWTQY